MSTLQITRYARKPMFVHAVQVSEDNMDMVAEWCGGTIKQTAPESAPAGETGIKPYIHVNVVNARHEGQTQAFVGDWVLKVRNSFKVFNPSAFTASFEEVSEDVKV